MLFFKPKKARKFKGCSEEICRCFKEVSKMFQLISFKGVSQKFQGCSNEVSSMFQKSFKGVSKFQGCFKKVSRVF